MFSKFEIIGAGFLVALMAGAIYLVQLETAMDDITPQSAAVANAGLEVVDEAGVSAALESVMDNRGNFNRMVIDDIKIGEGAEVQTGDTVSVHYAGRLQDGTEFDNSKRSGAPFEFVVGGGQVIAGWEEGLLGMKVGGERILVVPPEKGYGERGIGPIPPNATLVFSIELLEIN